MPLSQISPPWWGDKPVILVGGGPSLRGFDFRRLASLDAYVVGINQAIFDAPCHAGVTIDRKFVANRERELEIAAQWIPVYTAYPFNGAIWLRRRVGRGLSTDPTTIITIGTSGYAGVNVAVLKRARRIVLLGYDYGEGERTHYHDAYPWRDSAQTWPWGKWAAAYESMLPTLRELDIEVVNASPQSAITCFRKISLGALFEQGHKTTA